MKNKLKRELGLWSVFAIATGAMISSGLFILPGMAYARAGPSVFLSYFFAGLLAVAGMLSQAELISAMPRAGGDYFYVTRTLGPAAGTVSGLLTWASLSFKSAFALIGMATFLELIVPINMHVAAIALTAVFVALNILGAKEASLIQKILVVSMLGLLLLYIFEGIQDVRVTNFEPFAFDGLKGIISTAGMVFISYGGLLKVASVAEEVKNPGKNIPLGMFISFFVVVSLYFLVILTTVGVLGDKLANSLTPITDGAAVVLGSLGQKLIGVAAVLAFVSTANAGIMAAARYPFALSRDGLLPTVIGRLNRFGVPFVSVLLTGALILGSLLMPLKPFVKAASSVLILSYAFACLSLLIMRFSGITNYRPQFRAPLFPYIQIIGLAGYLTMVIEMGLESILITIGIGALGLVFYMKYGGKHKREFALLHLIARITDKKIAVRTLENELMEIIIERDEIVEDRFDRLVKKSKILDIKGKISKLELFRRVAAEMALESGLDFDELFRMLEKREKESSTAITPFIAIPHVVIDGEKKFSMVVVRALNGVYFSETAPEVKAIFFLVGTRDERQFHLQALAAIAQIVGNPNFEDIWLNARDVEDLRDILLLSRRVRA